jgi:hypothetical protein
MPPSPEGTAAVRRFRRVRNISFAVKVAALAGLLLFVLVYFGGL